MMIDRLIDEASWKGNPPKETWVDKLAYIGLCLLFAAAPAVVWGWALTLYIDKAWMLALGVFVVYASVLIASGWQRTGLESKDGDLDG